MALAFTGTVGSPDAGTSATGPVRVPRGPPDPVTAGLCQGRPDFSTAAGAWSSADATGLVLSGLARGAGRALPSARTDRAPVASAALGWVHGLDLSGRCLSLECLALGLLGFVCQVDY